MRKQIYYLLLILVNLFFLQCDRFTGADLDSEPPEESATIHGLITNTFTGSPVAQADVTIETYQTQSDGHGEYLVVYLLRDDEILNKPVKLQISAPNYLPLSDQFQIFPTRIEQNYLLDYAAPIIRRNVYISIPSLMVCQVKMVDYQGIHTLSSVIASFKYDNPSTYEHLWLEIEMDFIEALSDTSGYYQAVARKSLSGGWILDLKSNYHVEAIDNSGYQVRQSRQYSSGQLSDTLLFPPVLP
jgi:hypothetical protein